MGRKYEANHYYEYYTFLTQLLTKERMCIISRGRLSDEEDRRLTEIDAELDLYQRFLKEYNN